MYKAKLICKCEVIFEEITADSEEEAEAIIDKYLDDYGTMEDGRLDRTSDIQYVGKFYSGYELEIEDMPE